MLDSGCCDSEDFGRFRGERQNIYVHGECAMNPLMFNGIVMRVMNLMFMTVQMDGGNDCWGGND